MQTLTNDNRVLYHLSLISRSPGRSPELILCPSGSRTLSKKQNLNLDPLTVAPAAVSKSFTLFWERSRLLSAPNVQSFYLISLGYVDHAE